MLTIPAGSTVTIPDVAFIYSNFLGSVGGGLLYTETAPHLKETSAKTRSMARYGATYTYKGHTMPSYEFTPFLQRLKVGLEWVLGVPFNAAVVNRYATGLQGVAPHNDTSAIPELGKQPVIAGVSFGATRPFVLQGRKKADQPVSLLHRNKSTPYLVE